MTITYPLGRYTLLVFLFGPLYHFGTTFFNSIPSPWVVGPLAPPVAWI